MTREVSAAPSPSVPPPSEAQENTPGSKEHHSQSPLHNSWFRGLGIGMTAAGMAMSSIRQYVAALQTEEAQEGATVILFQPKLSLDVVRTSEKPLLRSSFDSVRIQAPDSITSETVKSEIAELKILAQSRTAESIKEIEKWDQGATLAWNRIARDLVSEMKLNPVEASRAYALLSVAQHDALLAARQAQEEFCRPAPSAIDSSLSAVGHASSPSYPSDHAAVASASRMVLAYIFPQKLDVLNRQAEQHTDSRLQGGLNLRSDIIEGDRIGRAVALRVIEYAAHDNPGAEAASTAPQGPGIWRSSATPPTPGLHPEWGKVRPWNMESGSQFRPEPPPAFESKEFKAALAEVRLISETRSPEQLRIATFWADGPGSATPPGHWNQIATELIQKYGLNDSQSSHVYATLNMAMADAGIACWDAKYSFWLIRPSQVDAAITTPVGLPNFPSYVSGHSTFSAAAAEVLSYFFPAEAKDLQSKAQEASMSRVYGGIHYRFDAEKGLELGHKVGVLAVERAVAHSMTPIPADQKNLQDWFKGLEASPQK